jgi:transmembrane sensor
MKTNNTYNTDWVLLTKYLSGNANDIEKNKMHQWIELSQGNKTVFEKAQKIWEASQSANVANVSIDNAWDKVNAKANIIPLGKVRQLVLVQKYILRIAAVLVIGLVSWYFVNNAMSDKTITATTTIKQLALSDGSEISLNKGATINYPENFSGNSREIEMNGEAFFDIAKNPQKPFIIHTSKADIKVLGTSFNVNTKPNGDLEVIVKTGVVAITSLKSKEQIILHKNERGLFNSANLSLKKVINEDENYIAWKTNKFVFKDNSLEYVFNTIEKVYGVKIMANEHILQCKLTATYDNLDIKMVMGMIDMTFGFKTIKNKDGYIVEGTSCEEN